MTKCIHNHFTQILFSWVSNIFEFQQYVDIDCTKNICDMLLIWFINQELSSIFALELKSACVYSINSFTECSKVDLLIIIVLVHDKSINKAWPLLSHAFVCIISVRESCNLIFRQLWMSYRFEIVHTDLPSMTTQKQSSWNLAAVWQYGPIWNQYIYIVYWSICNLIFLNVAIDWRSDIVSTCYS